MKTVKKVVALLLVFATVCSFSSLAFAAEAETTAAEAVEEKKEKKSIFRPLENVATIYLFYTDANPEIPHLWIYIENETDETLELGPYKIEPHGAVSMGAWKDRGMGPGIHVNLERYWVKDETYGRAYYIKARVNRLELKTMGKKFDLHNYWNWGFNCVWFALGMWNGCTLKLIPYLFSPKIALFFMFIYGAKRPDFTIKKLYDEDRCYKYITGGSLKTVYPGVLYTKTGV